MATTGQRALQSLPNKSAIDKRPITEYALPLNVLEDSLNGDAGGISVLKVSKTGAIAGRRLAFSRDRRNLLVTSRRITSVRSLFNALGNSQQSHKQIRLHWIDRIAKGPFSQRLLPLEASLDPESADSDAIVRLLHSDQCLTITYHSSESTLETLDILCPNKKEFELLLATLEDLVYLSKDELQRYSSSLQFLHFHWMCLKKDWESPMNVQEWLLLCDNIQVPLKKQALSQIFKECNKEKLQMGEVATLLDATKDMTIAMDPMQQLWKELVETDPVPLDPELKDGELDMRNTISAVALLSFIRSQQKKYSMTLEQVAEFCHTLNLQLSSDKASFDNDGTALVPSGRLSKRRFISWLQSDINDIVDPEKAKTGADDMTKPLSHYWIQTSHDTYLAKTNDSFHGKSAFKGSVPTEVDAYQYTVALQRGVRCLELDVLDGIDEPVVGRVRDKSIPLRVILKLIRQFLSEHPYVFPIILKIENRCSTEMQLDMANLFYKYFGAAKLLVKPPEGQALNAKCYLPSPESGRGKVMLLGKRPRKIKVGCTVLNDDFDDDNDGWEILSGSFRQQITSFADDESVAGEDEGIVVGFDTKGPVRSKENTLVRPPSELLELAQVDAARAARENEEAIIVKSSLTQQVEEHERLTAQLTQQAGMSPEEVKRRAAKAANRGETIPEETPEQLLEEKHSLTDEGVEMHELLPRMLEGNQDSYAEAAQHAMEAMQRVNFLEGQLKEAETALERSERDLAMSRELEARGVENSKRATTEARSHTEYADVASARVAKVKELVSTSEVQSSSAGTVVQTALTEAKISEKRASEAEAKALRALGAAEKDRLRADEETRKEENLEQEVSDLHVTCQKATKATQAAREQVNKANSMWDRVTEQIKLIETSSQYRKELKQLEGSPSSRVRHGGSFLSKHDIKVQERSQCREEIKLATDERSVAETRLVNLKSKFEETARLWRSQANLAAQARRSADRSSHVAEELAEHAEEEREAADLRQSARDKAMEAVENRGSQRESVEAQLIEAERAASEAAELAAESRRRAQKLETEVSKIKDHGMFVQSIKKREAELKQARVKLEVAREEFNEKEALANEEKGRLETNSAVYRSSTRNAETSGDRLSVVHVLQQEAIVAFNTTLMLRRQAESAITKSDIAASVADAQQQAAQHAADYNKKMDMMITIPVPLAKLTLLHSNKFLQWESSFASSHVCTHSFAQNVLLKMVADDPTHVRTNIHAYAKNHLCRVFPPWKAMMSKTFSNCDPVFAWSLGCQLVAMNFHSSDENLVVADGRFRQNGSSGYALQPAFLTGSAKVEHPQSWSFTVFGASNLPRVGRKLIQPRVRVSLYAGSTQETRLLYQTKPAEPNGLNPVWLKGSTFNFDVDQPSVAMISFSLWDASDEKTGSDTFVAGASFPVSCIREGYRSVSLFDGHHTRTGPLRYSSLLVKATKK